MVTLFGWRVLDGETGCGGRSASVRNAIRVEMFCDRTAALVCAARLPLQLRSRNCAEVRA